MCSAGHETRMNLVRNTNANNARSRRRKATSGCGVFRALLKRSATAPTRCWMLLTTCRVCTFEDAIEKLAWYTKRWGIEIYHKTLKSGCKIEQRQLGDADTIEACLAVDMVVAWRIYHMTKLGREVPDVPCTVFCEQDEWKALVSFILKRPIIDGTPPTAREYLRMVGSLGGFLGRKCDGEPGTKSIWLGQQRLDDIKLAYLFFVPQLRPPPVPGAYILTGQAKLRGG